jgi:light-regulated signal transduction histidine kinase (bacteriophytochrome)
LGALAAKIADDLRRRNTGCQALQVLVGDVPSVKADPQLMEIVLYNLFENACKFTGGRPSPIVEFGFGEHNGKSCFFVKDNGVGFDLQYADKLFRPFERLHSESEYPGTGIGLANVKRIIGRHGGEIWCDAKLNEGAAFFFTIGE